MAVTKVKEIIAHNDWDGVASAILVFPDTGPAPIVADYQDLPNVLKPSGAGARFFSEVHLPGLMEPSDVVMDHHSPKMPHLLFIGNGLTGYMATPMKVLAVSGNHMRDYSNVRAIHSILNKPKYISEEARAILREAIDPPEDLLHYSDVVDNPLMAETDEEVYMVLGHAFWKSSGRVAEIARKAKGGQTVQKLRHFLSQMARDGAKVAKKRDLESLAEAVRDGVILLAPRKEDYWMVFAAAFMATKWHGVKRTGYGYRLGGGRVRITLVSLRDRWALELAEKFGGGGRATVGGFVAGFSAAERHVVEYFDVLELTKTGLRRLSKEEFSRV